MRKGGRRTTSVVHSLLRWAGLDVRRNREPLRFLCDYPIRTVLDIGANEGQFATGVRRVLPEAEIHSFEPLSEPFSQLARRQNDDRRFFAYPLAMGESEGEVAMEQNEFTPSSSIMPCTDLHRTAFPFASKTSERRIKMTTLDRWRVGRELQHAFLVKMDVQGYEDRVLQGGMSTIAEAAVLIIEVSFAQLYEGQLLFDELYEIIRPLGFRCAGMIGNISGEESGTILQSDAIFVNSAWARQHVSLRNGAAA